MLGSQVFEMGNISWVGIISQSVSWIPLEVRLVPAPLPFGAAVSFSVVEPYEHGGESFVLTATRDELFHMVGKENLPTIYSFDWLGKYVSKVGSLDGDVSIFNQQIANACILFDKMSERMLWKTLVSCDMQIDAVMLKMGPIHLLRLFSQEEDSPAKDSDIVSYGYCGWSSEDRNLCSNDEGPLISVEKGRLVSLGPKRFFDGLLDTKFISEHVLELLLICKSLKSSPVRTPYMKSCCASTLGGLTVCWLPCHLSFVGNCGFKKGPLLKLMFICSSKSFELTGSIQSFYVFLEWYKGRHYCWVLFPNSANVGEYLTGGRTRQDYSQGALGCRAYHNASLEAKGPGSTCKLSCWRPVNIMLGFHSTYLGLFMDCLWMVYNCDCKHGFALYVWNASDVSITEDEITGPWGFSGGIMEHESGSTHNDKLTYKMVFNRNWIILGLSEWYGPELSISANGVRCSLLIPAEENACLRVYILMIFISCYANQADANGEEDVVFFRNHDSTFIVKQTVDFDGSCMSSPAIKLCLFDNCWVLKKIVWYMSDVTRLCFFMETNLYMVFSGDDFTAGYKRLWKVRYDESEPAEFVGEAQIRKHFNGLCCNAWHDIPELKLGNKNFICGLLAAPD